MRRGHEAVDVVVAVEKACQTPRFGVRLSEERETSGTGFRNDQARMRDVGDDPRPA
ncbi:hypothetical protein RFN58_32120 [Streptomyces iakyrus]|uniref:hypothetical protein n=1 Tax=Streptomyces iakyrus TaxID=68219 RepID=UPI000B311D9A|nr:hypothetical protein [Streptomyces iakyrus]